MPYNALLRFVCVFIYIILYDYSYVILLLLLSVHRLGGYSTNTKDKAAELRINTD